MGGLAGDANTTADYNTAVGYSALGANTTGGVNTAVGGDALRDNTTGGDKCCRRKWCFIIKHNSKL